MFNFLKKEFNLLAPVDGKSIDLSEVPDEVFSKRMAGDGIAIDATGSTFVAPADGVLTLVFNTNHAYALTLDSGAEILVHIGIDTVELKGEGFIRLKEQGKRVKAGEPIMKVDKQSIESKGYSLITPVLITNIDKFKDVNYVVDKQVKAAKDIIISYLKK